ncbi:hypothetical protein ACEWY4_018392 [Coilia grayii]|uniref:Reverse transcriptase domain-containing protein n=1 Tax=Coilia grayii TaxID=363190 RepID=A0ABD1JD19_9TELE
MFQTTAADINEFTEVALSYINLLTDTIIPTVKIKSFPNQKPWVDKDVRMALKTRTTTYNAGLTSGDMSDYKAASYSLRRTIKDAKRRYRDRVEADFMAGDPERVWKGLRTITGFERKSPSLTAVSKSLPSELNAFYACFDAQDTVDLVQAAVNCDASGDTPFCVTEIDVRNVLSKVNCKKASGPDGVSTRVLKSCAVQLAPVFTYIFNTSLAQETVPTCFKQSIIVPVPKNKSPSCLNDYQPVALTSTVMKCFERLVKNMICSTLPSSFDPFQFAYRTNRSREDAITNLLHSTLTHLEEGKGNYVRMLFIDFSSAFNTIIPLKLVTKMKALGLNSTLCHWILDFLTNRSQVVRVGGLTSDILTINTGAPQGCVLSPLLYNIYTHDCKASSSHTSIIKFADDTVVMGLISNNNEQAYLDQVEEVAQWCQSNSLTLNVSKTKEMVVDYRRQRVSSYTQLMISGQPVERVPSFKYLGVHITEDLTWTVNTQYVLKKSRQRLFFLRQLRKFKVSSSVLKAFYTSAIESVLTGSIITWYGNSTVRDCSTLQRVVRSAERTIRTPLPALQDIYPRRVLSRAQKILKDSSHPGNELLKPLKSGRRLRNHLARTERLRRSFYPQAIRTLNTQYTDFAHIHHSAHTT